MWQTLKKFRQAYLEAKGNRLHAEAEASRNALCSNRVMSVEEVGQTLQGNKSISWGQAFHQAHIDCTKYEEEQAYYER